MIDEKKLIEEIEKLVRLRVDTYGEKKEDDDIAFRYGDLKNIINGQPKIGDWIPCAKQLPKNEQEVEITYVHNYSSSGEPSYLTARAFYEDGALTVDESAYDWAENEYYEYIEETDSYMVPKGWYEDTSFAEEFAPINETVIAWRPIGEPYKPTTEE